MHFDHVWLNQSDVTDVTQYSGIISERFYISVDIGHSFFPFSFVVSVGGVDFAFNLFRKAKH